MKIFKRAISVFLAVLMILSSMSAFAEFDDGNNRSLISEVRFYHENAQGKMVETTRLAKGESVEARIVLQSDFIVGMHVLYYLYDKNVLEPDTETQTDDTLDVCEGVDLGGSVYYDDENSYYTNNMVNLGYISSDVYDDYSSVMVQVTEGITYIFDGKTELYKVHFKVKEDAASDAIATMFIPTETAMPLKKNDANYNKFPTYAARVQSADEVGVDSTSLDDAPAPFQWTNADGSDATFQVYNVASDNINTVGTSQGFTASEIAANTSFAYNGTTAESSFLAVSDKVTINFYVPADAPTGYTEYDSENGETANVNWSGYVPVRKSGSGTSTTYYYRQTSNDLIPTTSVLTGEAPTVPSTVTATVNKVDTQYNVGNIQMIPDGYYFAGWAPVDLDSEDEFDPATADLSLMASQASIASTVSGISYDYSTSDGKKITAMVAPDEIEDYYIADPNAATFKPLSDAVYGSFIKTDADTGDKTLDLIAVILPVPTEDFDVTVSDITVPGGATITGGTITKSPADSLTEEEVLGVLSSAPAEVAGYTFGWYVNDTLTPLPISSLSGAITITGKYTAADQALEYYIDGVKDETLSTTVATGETYTLADKPADANGYTFSAWKVSDAADAATAATTGTMPAGGIKVYSTKTGLPQTITYVVDGTVDTTITTTANTGDTYTLADKPADKDGYTYSAWKVSDAADAEDAATTGTMPNGGITVYSTKAGLPQTITYVVDGTADATITTTANTGDTYTLADKPADKDGYTYSAWKVSDAADAEDAAKTGTMPNGGITVYSVKTGLPQAITYYVDGTVDTTITTTANTGDTYTLAGLPTAPEGYTYTAWKVADDKTAAAADTTGTMPNGGITVYAVKEGLPQTITYIVDGTADTTLTPATANTGDTYTLATVPAAPEGYTFSAWKVADAADAADADLTGTMPVGGITVYAVKSAKNYTITYNANGGTDVAKATVAYGTDITSATTTRDGYSFVNWTYKDADGNEYTGKTMPAYNLTATANWIATEQTITYNVVNDTTYSKTETYATDATVTSYKPEKNGYTFSGWFSDEDCTVAAAEPTTMGAANVVLYGKFTAGSNSIVYKVEGEADVTKSADTGDAIPAYTPTAKTGYTFSGWFTDDTYTTAADLTGTMPAGGMTVYGKFNANKHTVTYNANGTEFAKFDVNFGEAITEPDSEPTKANATFINWLDADDNEPGDYDAMPDKDLVFTAQFEDDVTFTFDPKGGTWSGGTTETKSVSVPYDASLEDALDELGLTITKDEASFEDWSQTEGNNYEAVWLYTITFKYTNERKEIITVDTLTDYYEGDDVDCTSEDDPKVPGYTFDNWYDAEEGGTSIDDYDAMPDHSLVFWAQFTADPQDIHYIVDGVEDTDLADSVPTGETYKLTESPAATAEYTYSAWKVANSADAADADLTGTMPAGGITVYSVKTPVSYKVTFKSRTNDEYYTEMVAFGGTITVPATPDDALDGWVCRGFNEAVTGLSPADFGTMPARDVVFTGTYFALNQDLEYYIDGEKSETLSTKVYTGGNYTLADLPTAPAGYEYTAWVLADGTAAALTGKMPAGGIKVYTTKSALDQDLEYYVIDETVEPETTTAYGTAAKVKTDANITLADTPDEDGYRFTDWTLEDGSAVPATMPAGGLKVYSTKTAQIYDIFYDVKGGTAVEMAEVAYGDAIPDAKTTKTGYTFDKWTYADVIGTDYTGTTMPAYDLYATANWTADDQTIIYKVDGVETALTPASAKTDADVVLADKPVKDGYEYTDWTLEDGSAVPGTMPVGGITVVSTGTAQPQMITYYLDGTELKADEYKDQTALTDAALSLAALPEKTGYTVTGWTLKKASDDSDYTDTTMPAGGIKAYAVSTVNQYSVTIRDGENNEIVSDKYNYGTAVPFPTADKMKVEGKNFTGWAYTDGEGNTKHISAAEAATATVPAYDVVYTAEYGATAYTVTIRLENLDGTYSETPITRYAATGETVAATDADKTATGYVVSEADSVLSAEVAADGTTALVVTLNRAEYKVYTVVDGGAATEAATVKYGDSIPAIAKPSKTGYTFHGWYSDAGCTADFDLTEMPANDITVYGKLTINRYNITYNTDGGTDVAVNPATVTFGDPIPAATTSKSGYEFTGWTYKDADGNEYTEATMPAYDLTATANFGKTTYAITFYVDGKIVAKDSYESGATINFNVYKAEDGMKLDGWYSDEDCTAKYTDTVMPEGNVSVYAKTEADTSVKKTVTLTDEDGNVIGKQDAAVGSVLSIDTAVPSKTGYTNGRWEYNGVAANGMTMPNEDITVVAAYDPISYTVTYKNGDETVEAFTVAYGDDIEETSAEPEKAGYEFAGWLDADNKAPEDYTSMPANDLTFTAQFTALDQPITYLIDGKDVTESYTPNTAKTGEKFKLAEKPVDTAEYTYTEWAMADGSEMPATMPAGGITVESTANAVDYTITYVTDGTAVAPATVAFNEDIPTTAESEKEGYTFKNWTYTDKDGNKYEGTTMPAYDLTATANFTINSYKVSYVVDGTELSSADVEYKGNVQATKPEDNPSKTSFTFTGWFDGAGKALEAYTEMPAADVTFTAKFEADRVFTFNPAGGTWSDDTTDPKTVSVAYNEGFDEAVAKLTYTLTKEGYTLDETSPWTLDGADVYSANWNINEYTVYFMVDGTEYDSFDIEYKDTVTTTAKDDPEKAGYTFEDWYDADGKIPDDYAEMPAHDLTFTAKFNADEQKLEYYVIDKTVDPETTTLDSTSKVKTDDPITLAEKPEDTAEYAYTAWALADGTAVPATMPAGGLKVYTTKTAKEYTIIYVTDGTAVAPATVAYGKDIPAAASTKDGYDPAVWTYTDKDGNTYTGTTMPAYDLTATATWTALDQNLEYYIDGTLTNTVKVKTGETYTLADRPTDEAGKTYSAWKVANDKDAEDAAPTGTMPAGGIKVYSISTTKKIYTFDANGGTWADGTTAAKTVETAVDGTFDDAKAELAKTTADPTRSGYEFAGWAEDADTATLTAQWKAIVKLVPVDGTTTVVERDGVAETYNSAVSADNTYTINSVVAPFSDTYGTYAKGAEDSDTYGAWYITGIKTNMTTKDQLDKYITVTGGGYYTIETDTGYIGTGTVIKVYTADGEFVEQFYIVIYGDINNSASADVSDLNGMQAELDRDTNWSRGSTKLGYNVKAADLNQNGGFDVSDENSLQSVLDKDYRIDQATGTLK